MRSKEWKLNINISKTKALIFDTRDDRRYKFTINNLEVEKVKIYKYLGTLFAKSGSFLQTRKHLVQQTQKAMYLLFQRIYNLNLPFDLILQLFDNTISPILTYSAEVWGNENLEIIEKIHTDFLRKISKLRKSTPKYMLYSELGRYPIEIHIKCRMIGYWNRLITGKQSKLSYQIYRYMNSLPKFESKWIKHIKSILMETGRFDYWVSQNNNIQTNNINKVIKQVLLDQNLQQMRNNMDRSNKGRNYSIYKDNIGLEEYLLKLKKGDALTILKFRTGNHFFPIETGRWDNIDFQDRECQICNLQDPPDEFHYLLKCPHFKETRQKYLKPYFITRPNVLKFRELMQTKQMKTLNNLSKFIKILLQTIKRQ